MERERKQETRPSKDDAEQRHEDFERTHFWRADREARPKIPGRDTPRTDGGEGD